MTLPETLNIMRSRDFAKCSGASLLPHQNIANSLYPISLKRRVNTYHISKYNFTLSLQACFRESNMKLYKYTPYINAFLESSALPLTPMWQLNDPFEAKLTDHFIDSFENSMRESRLDFSELLIAESVKNLKENGRYKGIVSFSKRRFDTLMMTHYGDEHRGGVLEFEVDDVAGLVASSPA